MQGKILKFADAGLFHPPNNCEMDNIVILILQIGKWVSEQLSNLL